MKYVNKKTPFLISAFLLLIAVSTPSEAEESYYVERKSYGTGRETDPPKYVKQANKTWLKNNTQFKDLDWLDIGVDHRVRFEIRDNDYRRKKDVAKGIPEGDVRDHPILLKTRVYVGIKNVLDPFRFTVELQDSQRNNGQFTRDFDTRDINRVEPIQSYVELYFKNNFLGKDNLANERPISIRAGRQAFEYLDRRLFARNEWRNTTNTHQGVRAIFGQKKNDWQLDVLALQPLQRFTQKLDQINESQEIYGVIFDWRRWSDIATIQPYYYVFTQDGSKVKYTINGSEETKDSNKIDRDIHTGGIRAFGVVGKTGFDYDINYVKQWGKQQKTLNGQVLDHDAYSYNAEIGYSLNHSWKPRFSVFYGFASGDKNPNDDKNQRFDAPFGFARPWSNNDYFDMANICASKIRVEFDPPVPWTDSLKIDAGFSWFHLDSATDRWRGGDLQDTTGQSGKDVGKEFDIRARFPINPYIYANFGYAHFWAGNFLKNIYSTTEPTRRDDSDFLYAEFTFSIF